MGNRGPSPSIFRLFSRALTTFRQPLRLALDPIQPVRKPRFRLVSVSTLVFVLRRRVDIFRGSGDNNPRTLPQVRPSARSLFGSAAWVCFLLPFF